ncbi:zinc finger protein-like 1 homolog [Diaphorina citri]|uniref:Zinc finger protein-like 1 homolog n=1 Tax=Diaphorina citri TaxID=121845 RepID=A0A1S4ESX5_DIACI|nr:zinc finger protein-like 1 homolog [Diaphorina citri]XP_017305282.1 zinc finger protein-like 1 homolog [Diaphorina citri]XP_017305283.1 zinc finger protein-like 1 homolog [Diaphorina citri]XP_017305284.1 zinc finger protein-like 1 homolog [Diaphorina citri]
MGLCKCPKRKVTNQFCYEHRVNVCEYCMVTNHPKCIVQSYLQWLEDSDYNPTCELCRKDLAAENCIRLTCYHVYHWSCLNHYARQLPSTTAPAGYKCPQCKTGLFPPNNLVSPVADVLREKLSSVNWARVGLGLPLLNDEVEHKPSMTSAAKSFVHTYNKSVEPADVYTSGMSVQNTRRVYQSVDIEEVPPSHHHHHHPVAPVSRDHDENKYKRRSIVEWISRWWMSTYPSRARSLHPSRQHLYRRYLTLSVLIIIGLITLILVFNQLGHLGTDGDPNFDPLSNPNIHVKNIARE